MKNNRNITSLQDIPKNNTDFKKAFKKLFVYSKQYNLIFITALVLSIIACVLILIAPNQLSRITNAIKDGIMGSVDLKLIVNIATLLCSIYVITAILNYVEGFMLAKVSQKVTKKMRYDITRKISNLSLKTLSKQANGDIASRVSNDVDTISQTLSNVLSNLVAQIVLLVGTFVMMFVTNWILAISTILATFLGVIIMGVIIKKSQKHFADLQKGLGVMNSLVEESFSGHDIVKLYNAKGEVKKQFDEYNENLYRNSYKSQFLSSIMMPLMTFVGNFGFVVVCVIGAVLAFNGSISFGVIVAFMLYVRLFTQPLGEIGQSLATLQSTAAASERVFNFLEEKELINEDDKIRTLEKIEGKIEFKHVKFGYDEDKTIINDFSCIIDAGQKVAIVGPTGAGKTTLVNLLMRFYDLNEGEILIDDVLISDLKREYVHTLFSMVLQDTWLFEGTIRENLIFNNPKITDEEIFDVCVKCGLDHFIRSLPKSYDTVLDEKTTLSNGQRQLLTIARAYLQNKPMLILDEATSSVDTRSEAIIQKALDELTKGKTTFIIAHRLSTIKNTNIILVIKDGDIIEKGSHDELLNQDGFYAKLYNSQFENCE